MLSKDTKVRARFASRLCQIVEEMFHPDRFWAVRLIPIRYLGESLKSVFSSELKVSWTRNILQT